MTTNTTTSVQLPDLPALTRSFELRTNRACRSVSLASEASFLDVKHEYFNILSEQERTLLPSVKIGLLSGLCFPTCDPPQLRFLTNFVTVLVFAHERLLRAAAGVDESGWPWTDSEDWHGDTEMSGVEILKQHEMFKNLTHELSKFCSRATPAWHARFSHSVLAYKRAQLGCLQPSTEHQDNPNALERYALLRRDTSGACMVFDLLDLALGHKLEGNYEEHLDTTRTIVLRALETLRELAADIVALSSDVVSYNQFQSATAPHCLFFPHNAVAVCMLSKHLSAQGATNVVVKLVKDKIHSFLDIEQSLRRIRASIGESLERNGLESSFQWIKSSLSALAGSVAIQKAGTETIANSIVGSLATLPHNATSAGLLDNVITRIQVPRDYVAGNVHWFYETELYFGTKGDEVREFGWVFLNPPLNINSR